VLPGPYGCAPGGAPTGALVGALVALGALPLLGQGTRSGERAAHRPAATTTTAARLLWLAIAAALGRWLAEGLLRRRGWARWAAVVAFSLLGITSLAGLVDWTGALMRSRADGRWPIPAERVAVDLATPVLFLAISIGVIVLLMTPATRRDFRSSHQLPAGANGSGPRQA
jgi:hypothetical protein